MAVILSNTGIALLAYMDGVNQTPTLGGVVLAAAASAGSAVYKVCIIGSLMYAYIFVKLSFYLGCKCLQVLFKRVMGEVSFCQVSIFFTMIGLCSALLFWPIMLTLALTGLETVDFGDLPIAALMGALLLSLGN